MGAWADRNIDSKIVVGRARSFVSDRDTATFIRDAINSERRAAAKATALTSIFGGKAAGLSTYVTSYPNGTQGILDALASNTETQPIVDQLLALIFVQQFCREKASDNDSRMDVFADTLQPEIHEGVLTLQRIGPEALSLTQSAGSPQSLGGALVAEY